MIEKKVLQMANITPRMNKKGETSYLIRVFVDENKDGKQKVKSMTWKPTPGMSSRTIEKELNRQVTLFEEKVKGGFVSYDGNTRFEDYASQWMENASLAPTTHARYIDLLKRINTAIGQIRLEKLQAHHLESFYKNLKESGIKEKGRYATSNKLASILEERNLSKAFVSSEAGIAASTVGVACRGERISIEKANAITAALKLSTNQVFTLCEGTTGLSDKTIHHHHALISAILESAKRSRLIPYNVAKEFAHAPKVKHKEAVYLDDNEAQHIVELLLHETDIRSKTAIMLLLYSGVRRGELCGLEWKDIDTKSQTIHILRASQYQRNKGIVSVPTKNESSIRTVKLPQFIFEQLAEYKHWQASQRLKVGDRWVNSDRLFVQDDGKPINPDTINYWLNKFIHKNNLEHFTPHSLRHTFATLQIAAGVDLRTLQARTGHAQASTLVNIYSHAIKSAEEAASEALDNMLTPTSYRTHSDKSCDEI